MVCHSVTGWHKGIWISSSASCLLVGKFPESFVVRYTLHRHEHTSHLFPCNCNPGIGVLDDAIGTVGSLPHCPAFSEQRAENRISRPLRLEPQNGTPDLSGVWVSVAPEKAIAPNFAGAPGSGGPPFMNIENFLTADSSIVMLPAAESLYREHGRLLGAGRPSEHCLPHGIPDAMLIPGQPFKIVQTTGLTLILFEEFNHYRQVFTDGRPFSRRFRSLMARLLDRPLDGRHVHRRDGGFQRSDLAG